ncbi:MAG: serine protease [Defluviitaleaceae bacterium]|nr:serine protease [Defluviitaleaceae bacterium]
MQMNFEQLAKSTLRIACGNESGSGFHFIDEKTIITNYHVIENHITNHAPVIAFTECKTEINLKLIAHSDKKSYDFAIFEAVTPIPVGRTVLMPKISDSVDRGTEICFAGFPHGIDDLLVHKAYVSGPYNSVGFYIDGSVNGGNSGGPIIDMFDGKVIGIVTQRRFLGGHALDNISNRAEDLSKYCQSLNKGSVSIMGIDFRQFAGVMAESFVISSKIVTANSNVGIGIGFHIKFVEDEIKKIKWCNGA